MCITCKSNHHGTYQRRRGKLHSSRLRRGLHTDYIRIQGDMRRQDTEPMDPPRPGTLVLMPKDLPDPACQVQRLLEVQAPSKDQSIAIDCNPNTVEVWGGIVEITNRHFPDSQVDLQHADHCFPPGFPRHRWWVDTLILTLGKSTPLTRPSLIYAARPAQRVASVRGEPAWKNGSMYHRA